MFFKKKISADIKIDWLVAGLGNPGDKYSMTRHNIGWLVAIALCERYGTQIVPSKGAYMQSSMKIGQNNVLVALPTTYMNNSGEAILAISKKYQIPNENILVIVDEYNFPVGKIHIRLGGGDGGHNGISSVISHLGTNDFLRLRCGIGKNFPPGGMVDYVLSDFSEEEIVERDKMIIKSCEAIDCIIKKGSPLGMSLVNSGKLWDAQASDNNTDDKKSIRE